MSETTITTMLRDITKLARAMCPGSRPTISIKPDIRAWHATESERVFVEVRYKAPSMSILCHCYEWRGCSGDTVLEAVSDLRDEMMRLAHVQLQTLGVAVAL